MLETYDFADGIGIRLGVLGVNDAVNSLCYGLSSRMERSGLGRTALKTVVIPVRLTSVIYEPSRPPQAGLDGVAVLKPLNVGVVGALGRVEVLGAEVVVCVSRGGDNRTTRSLVRSRVDVAGEDMAEEDGAVGVAGAGGEVGRSLEEVGARGEEFEPQVGGSGQGVHPQLGRRAAGLVRLPVQDVVRDADGRRRRRHSCAQVRQAVQ